MTLAERKQETRDALVATALEAFARDGYHAASLETIATEAGYSKGAIYSNFDGKAGLFLAVMDFNLEALRGEQWNPLDPAGGTPATDDEADEAAAMVRGFGLATLEFIASAARDENLAGALRERIHVMIDGYQSIADDYRSDDEQLTSEQIGRLMAALDQGVSMLSLTGVTSLDGALLRTGLRRLVDPRAAADQPPEADETSPLPDVERVGQLIRDLDEP